LSIAIVCFVAVELSPASGVGTTWLDSGADVNVAIVHTGTWPLRVGTILDHSQYRTTTAWKGFTASPVRSGL
jgi:hypothetical protein